MSKLSTQKCAPCQKDTPPLKGDDLKAIHRDLGDAWQVVDQHHLHRIYKFKNFREALQFANQIGELAESENHHPDILTAWGKVEITLCTHSINGLSTSDFILAAKIEEL